jgi:hypothetical protein
MAKTKDKIVRFTTKTKAGNRLALFYKPDNDLLVVALIDKAERVGNELVRKTLDEAALLSHA